MTEGRLSYNSEQDRYGLLVADLWHHPGLHCGETLEIWMDGEWVPTRMEMDVSGLWYLVNTPFISEGIEHVRARL